MSDLSCIARRNPYRCQIGPLSLILPFANLSADPEQEYFSDGVADDIITELSRERSLFVIARNSSFTYRGRSIDIKQVGLELGVRYVVEGSVRRYAGRVRVTAQLIDAIAGNHIWAERYDRDLVDVFAVQDEIAEAVAGAIRPAVGDAEQRRVLRKPPGNLSAWETYQRGLWHLSVGTSAENEQARDLFKQAIEIDPGFVSPYIGLVQTYVRDVQSHGLRSMSDAARAMEVDARKAIAVDPNDSEAQEILAQAFVWQGNLEAALDRVERALALNHNSASAIALKGAILSYSGRCSEGRELLLASLRLNPRDPATAMVGGAIAASYYVERRYAEAVEAARRCLTDHPAYHAPRRFLVAALGQLGREGEGAAALHEWLKVAPDVFEVMVRNRPPYVRVTDHEQLFDGLRKAG